MHRSKEAVEAEHICAREVAFAASLNKRLAPVVIGGLTVRAFLE